MPLDVEAAPEVYMNFLMYTGRYLVYWDTINNALLSIFDLQKSTHELKKHNIIFLYILLHQIYLSMEVTVCFPIHFFFTRNNEKDKMAMSNLPRLINTFHNMSTL